MFSLIITIISIALVAALALATLYYGGAAFNKSSVDAEASRILLQGQQLLGAAELYFSEHRAWPTMQQLLDGDYLKSVPSVQGPMGQALAASTLWTTPVDGAPIFQLATGAPEVCRGVNRRAYGFNGILKDVRTAFAIQCYGTALNDLHTIITRGGQFLKDANGDPDIGTVTDDDLPTDPDDPVILVKPTDPVIDDDGNNDGGGGNGTPPPVVKVDEPPVTDSAPAGLTFSPAITFPATLVYTTATSSATVTNGTGAPVTLSSVASTSSASLFPASMAGPAPSCSSLAAGVLPAGQSCNVAVSYKPVEAVTNTGGVTLQGTASGNPFQLVLAVSGTGRTTGGTGTGGATLAEATNFGTLATGGSGPDYVKTFSIVNPFSYALNNVTTVVPAVAAGAFTVTNDCPATLAAGESCTGTATFLAPAEGSYYTSVPVQSTEFRIKEQQLSAVAGPAGPVVPPYAPQTFVLDTFTGSGNLVTHNGEAGADWDAALALDWSNNYVFWSGAGTDKVVIGPNGATVDTSGGDYSTYGAASSGASTTADAYLEVELATLTPDAAWGTDGFNFEFGMTREDGTFDMEATGWVNGPSRGEYMGIGGTAQINAYNVSGSWGGAYRDFGNAAWPAEPTHPVTWNSTTTLRFEVISKDASGIGKLRMLVDGNLWWTMDSDAGGIREFSALGARAYFFVNGSHSIRRVKLGSLPPPAN